MDRKEFHGIDSNIFDTARRNHCHTQFDRWEKEYTGAEGEILVYDIREEDLTQSAVSFAATALY